MPIFAPTSPGFGAVGSAHVWGARGRWFESSNPDLTKRADNRLIAALFSFPFYFESLGVIKYYCLFVVLRQLHLEVQIANTIIIKQISTEQPSNFSKRNSIFANIKKIEKTNVSYY